MTFDDTKAFIADEVAWAIEQARQQLVELKPTLHGDDIHVAHHALNRLNVAQYEVGKALEEFGVEEQLKPGEQSSLF